MYVVAASLKLTFLILKPLTGSDCVVFTFNKICNTGTAAPRLDGGAPVAFGCTQTKYRINLRPHHPLLANQWMSSLQNSTKLEEIHLYQCNARLVNPKAQEHFQQTCKTTVSNAV